GLRPYGFRRRTPNICSFVQLSAIWDARSDHPDMRDHDRSDPEGRSGSPAGDGHTRAIARDGAGPQVWAVRAWRERPVRLREGRGGLGGGLVWPRSSGGEGWRGLDEHEWVALDDGDDLRAVADQRGHTLQDVAGQRAAGTAGGGDREGLAALVVGAGAAERPAVAGVEGLLAGPGGPGLGGGGQVDGADRQRVGGAAAAEGAAGGGGEDEVEAGVGGGIGRGVGDRAAGLGGGQGGQGGVVGVHRGGLRSSSGPVAEPGAARPRWCSPPRGSRARPG